MMPAFVVPAVATTAQNVEGSSSAAMTSASAVPVNTCAGASAGVPNPGKPAVRPVAARPITGVRAGAANWGDPTASAVADNTCAW